MSLLTQQVQFSLTLGIDQTIFLTLNPRQDITGFSLDFLAQSHDVDFSFPPVTVPFLSDPPYILIPPPGCAVVPGQQPLLPATGSTQLIDKSTAAGTIV